MGGGTQAHALLALTLALSVFMLACGSHDSGSEATQASPDDTVAREMPRGTPEPTPAHAPRRSEPREKPGEGHGAKPAANADGDAEVDGVQPTPETQRQPAGCTRRFSEQQCARITEIAKGGGGPNGQSTPPK